jgi:hypothetical protein
MADWGIRLAVRWLDWRTDIRGGRQAGILASNDRLVLSLSVDYSAGSGAKRPARVELPTNHS